ncbi:MAG: hypothetical protein HYU36_08255 [Planctomycetes bacterium]|nr:hypothetical protein [Planctomycetota bacterium]
MMRGLCIAAFILAGALGAAAWLWNSGPRNPSNPHAENVGRHAPIGVDDLMRNVDRYRNGPIRVEGVVSLASSPDRTMTLIDDREYEKCGLGCAELMLPIRWSGAMPAVKEAVRVDGEIQEDGGKLIFVARSVERLDPKGTR